MNYCGCCGRRRHGYSDEWCTECSKHVASNRPGHPPYERTYVAQTGKECPYQA